MAARRWLALSLSLGLAGPLAAEEMHGPAAADLKVPAFVGTPMSPAACDAPTAAACDTLCDPPCGPPGRAWVAAEYLYGITSGNALPALATASPVGTRRTQAGVLGTPGVVTVIGGNRANNDFRSGMRANAGLWLNQAHTFGLEEDFFFLGRSRDQFVAGSADGSRIVSRPFVNAVTGLQDSELVSFPGVLGGTVGVRSSSEVIGGGFNFVCNHSCDPCGRFDWLVGFRYLNLRDDLSITENLTALSTDEQVAGTGIIVNDRFRTSNNFYGGTLGGRFERQYGRWFVGGKATVALGVNHQQITIDGSTTITPPPGLGRPTVATGGLLAQTSNIGRFTNDEFAVVPEVNLRAGAQLSSRARVYVGYNFVYWSNVVRSGDAIDLGVNPNLIPPTVGGGPARPAVRFKTTDFWLHGVSVGGELRF